jgi:cellulose synthase/poly-beta-1,6-N-acetylglucosamine synthase-like glycosyltransferase
VDIVYGDVRFFQNRPGVYWEWRDRDMEEETDILAALVRRDGKNITAQTLLYRKSALDRVGEWDETLYVVDRDYWLRAAWAGCRFRYSPGSLSFYGVHPGQMSSHAAAMSRGFEAVWTKALQYITQEPYRTEIRFSLARSRFRTALYADDLNSREALAKLAEARRTNPQAIPRFVYLLAGAIILIPGGRRLFRRLWKGPLRGLIAGLPFVKGKLKIE